MISLLLCTHQDFNKSWISKFYNYDLEVRTSWLRLYFCIMQLSLRWFIGFTSCLQMFKFAKLLIPQQIKWRKLSELISPDYSLLTMFTSFKNPCKLIDNMSFAVCTNLVGLLAYMLQSVLFTLATSLKLANYVETF